MPNFLDIGSILHVSSHDTEMFMHPSLFVWYGCRLPCAFIRMAHYVCTGEEAFGGEEPDTPPKRVRNVILYVQHWYSVQSVRYLFSGRLRVACTLSTLTFSRFTRVSFVVVFGVSLLQNVPESVHFT